MGCTKYLLPVDGKTKIVLSITTILPITNPGGRGLGAGVWLAVDSTVVITSSISSPHPPAVQNGEHFSNNIVTLQVEKFCNETCDDNVNFYEDELTRSIPIANDSEGDPLFKKKKKKKNRDKKMVQKDKHLKEDTSILNVVQFYNETIDDNVKYLNKINISAPNLNKEDFTTIIQIANASEDDEELTLLKSPFKKIKRKKKKSKMEINDGTQSSKYVTIQKNLKNMEDLKKNVSKEQSNEIHNGKICILQKCLLK
ncbi:unnamed protein product [Macrosiphum euphorbiae]|uniref:Uncharacterized protein n=1 Tax=Macrosiphum euphorbiae TaxID=13131 RepID=A0AAV0VZP5_9HEMI|nr:unnamed protein product [Macrosiphum euphorbiae]